MCVAAHPDDEDGTSLIVMRRKYGAHTVSLFSTFGEGGQNAIGPELYEELGAIRARETMAASEIQGSEPHFLGLKDFGFSKSADETFQKWGHDEALRRMVLQIRKLRPDVIITNHSVTSNDHGHHQATARMVVEAFDAAADAKRFPEQLKDGVEIWQVQRLFVRVRGSQAPPADTPLVTIDPNERDPVRGNMFAEQALSALQKHATQGPWPKTFAEFTARFRVFSGQGGATGQMPMIRYRLERDAKGAGQLGKDSHNFLDRLQLPDQVAQPLGLPILNASPLELAERRKEALAQIITAYQRSYYGRSFAQTKDAHRSALMKDRIEQALALVAGIDYQVGRTTPVTTPGARLVLWAKLSNHCCEMKSSCNSWIDSFLPHRPQPEASLRIPSNAPANLPLSQHLYDGRWRGLSIKTRCGFTIPDVKFNLERTTYVDVAAAIEIADISPSPLVIMRPRVGVSSAGADILPATPPKITVKLANHMNRPFKGELAFGRENRSPENRQRIELASQETKTLTVSVPLAEKSPAAHPRISHLADNVWFSLRNTGLHENLIKRAIPIVWVDARVDRNVSVGYIRGFDFSLPNALDALGVQSKELAVAEVKTADLSRYTSIIVDNRVYESQPELIAANQKLLDYANAGGTLIVFYHKTDEWNPDARRNRPQLAPYKLILGNERITDENAPITFLEPQHPLLNTPNKLGPEDFVGWIQERGLYYPKEWDAQFRALLQSNDPAEAPLKGGLLVADYGKGHYIYSSMVWYRQLRAGVPGAYRMLANMISYGREKS